eukprot:SAG22_NODE_1975_length_3221_cov_2.215247_3_plen_103_part_00
MASAVMNMQDSEEYKAAASAGAGSPWAEVMAHPQYWGTLLGTGGTWFLYDVSYYGTAIFMPRVCWLVGWLVGWGPSRCARCPLPGTRSCSAEGYPSPRAWRA